MHKLVIALTVLSLGFGGNAVAQEAVLAAPPATAGADRSFYSSERSGHLIISVAAALEGKAITADILYNGKILSSDREVKAGQRTLVPFSLEALPQGNSEIVCRLRSDGREFTTIQVSVRKLSPKSNEVKIDYARRGLIVDGLPYLPFGFYCDMAPAEALAGEEAPQGFNLLSPYQASAKGRSEEQWAGIRAYMDRCAQVGMKVNYHLMGTAPLPPSEEKWSLLKAEVEMFRDHPALLSWYISDEPDGQGIPPEILEEAYRFIQELDPYHPITIVLMTPSKVQDYLKSMDIIMADPYPIPNGPVTTVSDWAGRLNRAADDRMPLWIVPQAFGGGEWWSREPSAQEERVMTYLALIHNATGIQYFVRRAPIGNPVAPRLWSECRRLSLEAAELSPALLSGEPRPEITCSPQAIHAAAWQERGQVTVLAANTENHPASLRIQIQGSLHSGKAEALFENRQVEVKNGVIEEMIDAFGTRAYRIPVGPLPEEDLKIDPKNLTVNPSYEQSANIGSPDGCYVWLGADRGSSLFVDPRVARHGSHSLRVTTPREGQGIAIAPFPVTLEEGASYRFSIWAKAKTPGQTFEITLSNLDSNPKQFTLTEEWQECVMTGKATKNGRISPVLRLPGAGTAWLDMLQIVPLPKGG